ncbi:MAG: hypothetical protein WAU34_01300, partial [Desulfobacterales bacterium]
MLFNSQEFLLVFLPLTLILYFAFAGKETLRIWVRQRCRNSGRRVRSLEHYPALGDQFLYVSTDFLSCGPQKRRCTCLS